MLVVAELNAGKSVSAGEHFARATDAWGATLNDLGERYKSALRVIEEYEATKIAYEAARSVLSMEKEKFRLSASEGLKSICRARPNGGCAFWLRLWAPLA